VARKLFKLFLICSLYVLSRSDLTNSYFQDFGNSQTNSFSATCWFPPSIPTLSYPSNNYYAGIDSEWNRNPYMDWQDSITSCPLPTSLTYQYESYSDEGLTNRLNQSGWLTDSSIPASGAPEGVYYWRVRARDNFGNTSDFSSPWKLIVDHTRPTSDLPQPSPSLLNTQTFDLDYTGSDTNINYVQLCYSFNLNPWNCDHSEFRDTPHSPGVFHFTSPQGDGVYYFATIARDLAGNVEDKTLADPATAIPFDYPFVQVDSRPPTTNIDTTDLAVPSWYGQNLLGQSSWYFDPGSAGDHGLVASGVGLSGETITPVDGSDMLQLGFVSAPLSANASDSASLTVTVPTALSSTLSFWYRLLTNDTVDYDRFDVNLVDPATGSIIENFLSIGGNELPGSPDYTSLDTGWRLYQNSLGINSQDVSLWFGLTNTDATTPQRTWVYIDKVEVTTLDPRLGQGTTLPLAAHDTGSGLASTPSPAPVSPGENPLEFSSTDIAGNTENSHQVDVVVAPPLALNAIYFSANIVELYNNSSAAIDLSAYYLQNSSGQTQPLTSSVSAGATSSVFLSSSFTLASPADTISLFQNGNSDPVDKTDYRLQSAANQVWRRTPVGLGTWGLTASSPLSLGANIIYRQSVGKITLSVFNIGSTYLPLAYEIIYTDDGLEKGIAGTIDTDTVVGGKSDRDFILGTCSTDGCTVDSRIGNTIKLTIDDIGHSTTYLDQTFTIK